MEGTAGGQVPPANQFRVAFLVSLMSDPNEERDNSPLAWASLRGRALLSAGLRAFTPPVAAPPPPLCFRVENAVPSQQQPPLPSNEACSAGTWGFHFDLQGLQMNNTPQHIVCQKLPGALLFLRAFCLTERGGGSSNQWVFHGP